MDYKKGIEEYKRHNQKMYSEKTKDLKEKYINPLLKKASEIYKKEEKEVIWVSSFFKDEKILSRIATRRNGKYEEIEKEYLTKDILKEISQ